MTMMSKILVGGAGLAALAAAAPSAAQYRYGYAQPYGYGYGQQYGYGYRTNTNVAAQQCTAAVQNRLYTRNGLGGILGSLVGSYGSSGRVGCHAINNSTEWPIRASARARKVVAVPMPAAG